MRELKFRGLGENGWVYGDLFSAWAVGGIHPRIHWVEGTASFNQGVKPETVGQYTSLTDKNGVDIYEGDIIKGVFNSHPQNWTVGELSAYGLTFNRLTIKPSPSPYHYRDMRHRDQWEVIGNIYENPELIA